MVSHWSGISQNTYLSLEFRHPLIFLNIIVSWSGSIKNYLHGCWREGRYASFHVIWDEMILL